MMKSNQTVVTFLGEILKEQKKILAHVTSTRKTNKKIVFTNGCFDLLHKGHRDLIKQSLKILKLY